MTMTTPLQVHHRAVVLQFMEEVQNARQYARIPELCQADQVLDHPELKEPAVGLAILETKIGEMVAAFPAMRFDAVDVVTEGHQVAVRFVLTGTQTGWLGPVKPSGKPIVQSGMAIYDMRYGKIQEVRIREDLLQMLDQLGAIPDRPALLYWMKKLGVLRLLQKLGKIPS
jgi:predicted ester cyclase